MGLALLIDFGSTYTKVTAVDLNAGLFLGRSQAPSTVSTNVLDGFEAAERQLESQLGFSHSDVALKLASSSAAGGLQMVAVGLIGRLTSEAANRAALGAGARVTDVFERGLNPRTIKLLENSNPDIILLAGGIDGGNTDIILHNARQIGMSRVKPPVVVAGNALVAEQVSGILSDYGHQVYVCDNVMPAMNVLNVESARETIREVFIDHIVEAKGLDLASNYLGNIVMPTPMAVLKMAELLSLGFGEEEGVGDLMVLDVGGATTDVHTVSSGVPIEADVFVMGLEEPYAKRTVEGDLGLRVSANSLMDAISRNRMPRHIRIALEGNKTLFRMEYLTSNTAALPFESQEWEIDTKMAAAAAFIASERHAGRLETANTDFGTTVMVQRGKDLTQIGTLIGTGGILAFGRDPEIVLGECLFDKSDPHSLRPKNPKMFVDSDYAMYAGGLLATLYPEMAIKLLKNSLRAVEIP
tara:strand:+ start:1267 stop:2673 length:1407 start_codon:yes stop_codon:yes gene_type:complete